MPLTMPIGSVETDIHCDLVIKDYQYPLALRAWLLVKRLPAVEGMVLDQAGFRPQCYADYEGKRVRLTMASRFGDVGISFDLSRSHGYDTRVTVTHLTNFSDKP